MDFSAANNPTAPTATKHNPNAAANVNAAKKGTADLAKAYLDFLFTPAGQEIIARHNFRPRDAAVFKREEKRFAPIKLFSVDQLLGGWAKVSKIHFADGGQYDHIVAGIKR